MALFGELIPTEFFIAFVFGAALIGLIALAMLPAVHNRAVRVTTRRFEVGLPRAMTAIKAEKDQLRVDFAVATTKLESNIAELRNKTQAHVVAIAKNLKIIAALKTELEQRDLRIAELETRDATVRQREQTLHDQVRQSGEELAEQRKARQAAEAAAAEHLAERNAIEKVLVERTKLAEQQRSEIAVLRGQVEAIRREVIAFVAGKSAQEPGRGTAPSDIRGLAATLAAGSSGAHANGHGNGQHQSRQANLNVPSLAPVPGVPAPSQAPPKPFGQRGPATRVN